MTSYEEAVETGTLIQQANELDQYEGLRQKIGDIAEELAEFLERMDPTQREYAAERLIDSIHDRLTDLYNGS